MISLNYFQLKNTDSSSVYSVDNVPFQGISFENLPSGLGVTPDISDNQSISSSTVSLPPEVKERIYSVRAHSSANERRRRVLRCMRRNFLKPKEIEHFYVIQRIDKTVDLLNNLRNTTSCENRLHNLKKTANFIIDEFLYKYDIDTAPDERAHIATYFA